MKQGSNLRVIKAEGDIKKSFLPDSQKALPITNKDRKLDLGSLGRLFQNQPKDQGLVGDRYPRVHWKDKRPHERPKGPINRKVIPSWAWGGMTSEAY